MATGYHYVERNAEGKIKTWNTTKPVKNPEKVMDDDPELFALLNRNLTKSRFEVLADKAKADTITDAETIEAMKEFLKAQE